MKIPTPENSHSKFHIRSALALALVNFFFISAVPQTANNNRNKNRVPEYIKELKTGTSGVKDYRMRTPIMSLMPIDSSIVPQFVDPLPHFAGNRVNARKGGHIIIKAFPFSQQALSTGTAVDDGVVGDKIVNSPGDTTIVGTTKLWGYSISTDKGNTWTPAHWPAFTIEAQRWRSLTVEYRNELHNQTYSDVNLIVDQTIHWAMPEMTPDPYCGPVPLVTHLHGGEVSSMADGGPYSWFTPGLEITGPTWGIDGTSNVCKYPNTQEAASLWFHDHAMGATRLNVMAGLAGFYFLRGDDEEKDRLPGWSGDDLVKEVAPENTTGVFSPKAYLPEIEIAIQDRMFSSDGGLFWPNDPTNPDHPYWTPEFFGNIMTVNGKSWPYLSVANRKYRFRMLNGCNARFLKMWLCDNNGNGPSFTIIGTEGGLLDHPVTLDPANGDSLFMAPGERWDVVVDFTNVPKGTALTLRNNAAYPYPAGDLPVPEIDGQIMQFVVTGEMVKNKDSDECSCNICNSGRQCDKRYKGTDKSCVPENLRCEPIVKLTDFNCNTNLQPEKVRQLVLNEVLGENGPLEVLLNNSAYDNGMHMASGGGGMGGMAPGRNTFSVTDEMFEPFGKVTEHPKEGTTEIVQIINTTMDAHPIHFHLVQFQLVSRQPYDAMRYMEDWCDAFPGGEVMPLMGPPCDYDTPNADGAVGGNIAISSYLSGPARGPEISEMGWKDTYKALPGEITTFIIRYAPTDLPLNTPKKNLMFDFDPSKGPGYVWHCHIIDHEDNEMMRPYWVEPASARYIETCKNIRAIYEAPRGMKDYIWDIPGDAQIEEGGTCDDDYVVLKWKTLGEKLIKVNYTSDDTKLSVPSTFAALVVNGTNGLDNIINGSSVSISPNPNNGVFDINFSNAVTSNISYSIFDAIGREVYNSNAILANGTTSIPAIHKNLTPGAYTIRIESGDSFTIMKMIVE